MMWTVIVSMAAFVAVMMYVIYAFSNHEPETKSSGDS